MSALATGLVGPMVLRRPSPRPAAHRVAVRRVAVQPAGMQPATERPVAEQLDAVQPAGMRLTRRGRLVVGALATVVALLGVFASQQAVAGQPGGAVAVTSRTVDAGETLWDIASELAAPGQDVRDVVAGLIDLNGLRDAGLLAGQELLIPTP